MTSRTDISEDGFYIRCKQDVAWLLSQYCVQESGLHMARSTIFPISKASLPRRQQGAVVVGTRSIFRLKE